MKLLPENPTQFDYLHAIRAIAARGDMSADPKLKEIYHLADRGMERGGNDNIFSEEIKPNNGEQVVCIRADGWWGKGGYYEKYEGWVVNGMLQDIVYWMRVSPPNATAQTPATGANADTHINHQTT